LVAVVTPATFGLQTVRRAEVIITVTLSQTVADLYTGNKYYYISHQ